MCVHTHIPEVYMHCMPVCTRVSTAAVPLTLVTVSNIGIRTNLMNPIWAVALVTLSRSMNGATGRPSDFSRSLCREHSDSDIKGTKAYGLGYTEEEQDMLPRCDPPGHTKAVQDTACSVKATYEPRFGEQVGASHRDQV